MSDTKRILVWLFVLVWCVLSLCVDVRAQGTIDLSPLPGFTEQKCVEPVELAANTIIVKKKAVVSVVAGGCTSPTNGSIYNQSWSGALPISGWTQYGAAACTSAMTPPGTPPSGACYALRTDLSTVARKGIYYDFGAGADSTISVKIAIYFDSVGASTWVYTDVFSFGAATDPSSTSTLRLTIARGEGNPYILISGAGDSSTLEVAADTWYVVDLKVSQNATSYMRVNGGVYTNQEVSCSASNNLPRYLHIGGGDTTDLATDYYIGYLEVDGNASAYMP